MIRRRVLVPVVVLLTIMAGMLPASPFRPLAALAAQPTNTTYDIDNGAGCGDSYAGTSSSQPWCDFNNVNADTFSAGDQILLKDGDTWQASGVQMTLAGTGSSSDWITVSDYGSGARPRILGNQNASDREIRVTNPDYWTFTNLEVGGAGVGIMATFSTSGHNGLNFSNLYVHDCYGINSVAGDPNGDNVNESAGIAVVASFTPPVGTAFLTGLSMGQIEGTGNLNSIEIAPLMSGFPSSGNQSEIQNVFLNQLYLHGDNDGGGTHCFQGIDVQSVTNVLIMDSVFDHEAGCTTSTGTGSMFDGISTNFTYVNSEDTNVPESSSPDETGWDMEWYTDQTRIRSDYFAGNGGAGIELEAFNSGPGNYNSNNEVSGSLFVNNGTGSSTNARGAMSTCGTLYPVTGTAQNNLYWEPHGFNVTIPGCSGSWANFTFTNNLPADAQADTYNTGAGFSGTQGPQPGNPWSYQYYTTANGWSNMGSYNASGTDGVWSSWGANTNNALIWSQMMLPDSCNSCWTGRTWTAPKSGSISIRGWVLKASTGGNGVLVNITKNGTAVWGGSGTSLGANDQTGFSTNADTTVNAGDVIRFQINNGGSSNNTDDYTSWAPNIEYTSGGGGLPSGYVQCAAENGTCSFSGTEDVFYGTSSGPGQYYNQNLTNGTACTNAVFGDPDYGYVKACYIPGSGGLSFANAGFETPQLTSSPYIAYQPSGYSWVFENDTGIQNNASGFASSPAPEGSQTGFIQSSNGAGYCIDQTLNTFTANHSYSFTFSGAQRAGSLGGESIQVFMDSTPLGTFTPASTSFADITSNQVTPTTGGDHTIKFCGTVASGDHTAFIDNIRINGS